MTSKVYLSDEVRSLQNYMKDRTEEFRYRMNSCVFCDLEDIDGVVIIPDIIEPVCENIFKHAMIDIWEDCFAITQVDCENGMVTISIEDSGCGMTEEVLAEVRKNMDENAESCPDNSLAGIKRRLIAEYGASAGITVESSSGFGTTVIITIPQERG